MLLSTPSPTRLNSQPLLFFFSFFFLFFFFLNFILLAFDDTDRFWKNGNWNAPPCLNIDEIGLPMAKDLVMASRSTQTLGHKGYVVGNLGSESNDETGEKSAAQLDTGVLPRRYLHQSPTLSQRSSLPDLILFFYYYYYYYYPTLSALDGFGNGCRPWVQLNLICFSNIFYFIFFFFGCVYNRKLKKLLMPHQPPLLKPRPKKPPLKPPPPRRRKPSPRRRRKWPKSSLP